MSACRKSSAVSRGFNFTRMMRTLCDHIVAGLSEFSHVDMSRVAVAFSQTRKTGSHGLWATLTPMRFENGSMTTRRSGKSWTVQRLFGRDGQEMLYILSFYLPRFIDQSFDEKLATVIHELWHIGPRFDGDLRRHEGRCFAHGSSMKQFDDNMRRLAQRWLATSPPSDLTDFLRYSFTELVGLHGGVHGEKVPAPKLIPVETNL